MSIVLPSRSLLAGALFAAAILAASAPALAGERIEFKNGHRLVVESSRVEGDTVFVKLADGSEVGFPKALIAEVEEGHSPGGRSGIGNGSPRGKSFEELNGYQRAVRERDQGQSIAFNQATMRSVKPGTRLSVGFAYKGSVDVTRATEGTQKGTSVTSHYRQMGETPAPADASATGAAPPPTKGRLPVKEAAPRMSSR